MHFELSERLNTSVPPEAIIEFAAGQFARISLETTYEGQGLAVRMVEASFGSINRTDVTYVSLQRADGGYLLVSETEYKPSAWFWVFLVLTLFTYVGWIVPIGIYLYQRGTVKNAIQLCLDRIGNQFSQQVTQSPAAVAATSYLDDLKKLAELKESGVLTNEEFDAQKRKILGF